MKALNVTFIDNCSHGYYAVSVTDFREIMAGDITKVSGYSGMDSTKVYLEEDCDASLFIEKAKGQGFEVNIISTYQPNFSCSHNYDPARVIMNTMALKAKKAQSA